VWDSDDAFGGNGDGNGNETGEMTIGQGYCVTDGAFANLQVQYYNESYRPHCLSRDFVQGDRLTQLGAHIKPEALEKVLDRREYETFLLEFEDGPHSVIPVFVRGDFFKLTAPNGRRLLGGCDSDFLHSG